MTHAAAALILETEFQLCPLQDNQPRTAMQGEDDDTEEAQPYFGAACWE